jgi:hypothetical protein
MKFIMILNRQQTDAAAKSDSHIRKMEFRSQLRNVTTSNEFNKQSFGIPNRRAMVKKINGHGSKVTECFKF